MLQHRQINARANPLLEQNELTLEGIERLLAGDILALRVPQFYGDQERQAVLSRVFHEDNISYYSNSTGVGRIGRALVETRGSAEAKREYCTTSSSAMRTLRNLCLPYLSPFDKFRLELDALWPQGARVPVFQEGRAFAGLLRIFAGGGFANPHQDLLVRDAPEEPLAGLLAEQLAVNVYLQTSTTGGRLDLWDLAPSHDEYKALRNTGSHGVDRSRLPAAALNISPCDGDLILFRSTRLHAVEAVSDIPRVAWSCFVGFESREKALSVWS
jgi:hypothetical protein